MSLESGVNGGAYFTSTLKGMTGLGNLIAKPESHSITQQLQPQYPTPEPVNRLKSYIVHSDEPEPIDPNAMKKGWRLCYKNSGVSSLLSWVEKCLPTSLDVTKLWTDIQTALPGTGEPLQVDKFLDTVVIRMKHVEKLPEADA